MPKFKHIILAVAIAIVFAFFVGFGISAFYPTPKYEDFCGQREFKEMVTKESCETANGKWNPAEIARAVPAKIGPNQLLCTKLSEKDNAITLDCQSQEQLENQGYCDLYYYCSQEFSKVNEKYNRNVFIIATGIGIIALIVGIALKLASVSAGLMGGGILAIIYGTVRYWSDLPDYGRFIILGITLVILIWLGYKRINKS
ncbi:hypothetical protein HYU50_02085 [Candidatus Woesearchaeota archaeon]|nr:hypothetical protein [Candidatus Woesearchaeota archaeon]